MVEAVYGLILEWWWAILICLFTFFDLFVSSNTKQEIQNLIRDYDQYDDLSVDLILKKNVAFQEVHKHRTLKNNHFWLAVSTFILAGILVTLLKGNS